MRLAAAVVLFLAGVACGYDLTMWLTGPHCHSGLRCIHVWHHVAFTLAYLAAAFIAFRRIERG